MARTLNKNIGAIVEKNCHTFPNFQGKATLFTLEVQLMVWWVNRAKNVRPVTFFSHRYILPRTRTALPLIVTKIISARKSSNLQSFPLPWCTHLSSRGVQAAPAEASLSLKVQVTGWQGVFIMVSSTKHSVV